MSSEVKPELLYCCGRRHSKAESRGGGPIRNGDWGSNESALSTTRETIDRRELSYENQSVLPEPFASERNHGRKPTPFRKLSEDVGCTAAHLLSYKQGKQGTPLVPSIDQSWCTSARTLSYVCFLCYVICSLFLCILFVYNSWCNLSVVNCPSILPRMMCPREYRIISVIVACIHFGVAWNSGVANSFFGRKVTSMKRFERETY